MSEERGKTGREFIIVPRKQLELPKLPTRKVLRKVVRDVSVPDPSFDHSTEAIEV